MVLGPGIWHEEIKISGFSEVMIDDLQRRDDALILYNIIREF